MTEKRFRAQEHCLRSSYGIEAENWLVTNDNHSVVLNDKAEAHMVANMSNDVIDKLNELAEENQDHKAMIEFLSTENIQIMDAVKTRTQIQHQLEEENEQLKSSDTITDLETEIMKLKQENEQLKQQIKDLRINVLDSIHEADEIKCTCNPCVVEECVKKVIE